MRSQAVKYSMTENVSIKLQNDVTMPSCNHSVTHRHILCLTQEISSFKVNHSARMRINSQNVLVYCPTDVIKQHPSDFEHKLFKSLTSSS